MFICLFNVKVYIGFLKKLKLKFNSHLGNMLTKVTDMLKLKSTQFQKLYFYDV